MLEIIPLSTTRGPAAKPPGDARESSPGPSARPRVCGLGTSRLASFSRLLSAVSSANLSAAGLPLAPWRSATVLGNRLHCSPRVEHSTFRGERRKEISVQPRRQNVASPRLPDRPATFAGGLWRRSRWTVQISTASRPHDLDYVLTEEVTCMPLHPTIEGAAQDLATSLGTPRVSDAATSRLADTVGGQPLKSVTPEPAGVRSGATPSPRCGIRGCIFPAAAGNPPRCAQHQREASEPEMFESQQPSRLNLARAKYGLPDTEPDDSRLRARWQRERHRALEDAA